MTWFKPVGVKSVGVKSVGMKFIGVAAVVGMALAVAGPARAAMPASPMLMVTTVDGGSFNLAEERGRWVIVNYWATWCGPCVREMPDISRFVSAHSDKVAAIGLTYEHSDLSVIQAFLAQHPVSYPVAQVTPENPPPDFEPPRGLPTTWLIDPNGKVVRRFVGGVNEAILGQAIGIAQ